MKRGYCVGGCGGGREGTHLSRYSTPDATSELFKMTDWHKGRETRIPKVGRARPSRFARWLWKENDGHKERRAKTVYHNTCHVEPLPMSTCGGFEMRSR